MSWDQQKRARTFGSILDSQSKHVSRTYPRSLRTTHRDAQWDIRKADESAKKICSWFSKLSHERIISFERFGVSLNTKLE